MIRINRKCPAMVSKLLSGLKKPAEQGKGNVLKLSIILHIILPWARCAKEQEASRLLVSKSHPEWL